MQRMLFADRKVRKFIQIYQYYAIKHFFTGYVDNSKFIIVFFFFCKSKKETVFLRKQKCYCSKYLEENILVKVVGPWVAQWVR
jgi:hypothetical protein